MKHVSESENRYKPFSTGKMLAYSSGGIILSSLWQLRGLFQLYAEKALGISTMTVLLIGLIYIIWDAFNDPLTGYFLDKSKRFTSKRGKRFPFIIIGGVGAVVFVVLLYTPITTDPMLAAVWILIMLLIWDQFQTLFELSTSGLTVDIFRDKKQRVKLGTYGVLLGAVMSLVFGSMPSLVLQLMGGETVAIAYFYAVFILAFIPLIILIPFGIAVREPEEMIQLRTRLDQEGKSSSPFRDVMKRILTDKDWMSLVLVYLGYVIGIQCVTTGTSFYIIDGLGYPIGFALFFNVVFVLAGFISAPFWKKIAEKKGSKKAYLYSAFVFIIAGVIYPILGWNLIPALILSGVVGIGNAGAGTSFWAANSDTLDNATVKSGKREETSFNGVLRFFSATGIFFQILIFLLVEGFTGYDPNLTYWDPTPPTDLMRIGLNLRASLIPAIIYIITALIYLKFNKVTAEVAEENKKKLIEMDL